MPNRPDEIEAFKTEIDLRQVALSLGYELNERRSSIGSVVMDHPNGDRILVAVAADGHWIYCSVREHTDAGSVIDLWQRRQGGTLGDVRKGLRPFLGGSTPPPLPRGSKPMTKLAPVERDVLAARARYEGMSPINGYHAYLIELRRIPQALLSAQAFASRVRIDERGNAVFPHFNQGGLCGFEIKNDGFTGFARGGTKGLWASVPTPDDDTLVIAETAIDAISYAALVGDERRRFVSTAGQLNNNQPALLLSAMRKLSPNGRIVMALDNDEGGNDLAARIGHIRDEVDRNDLELVDERPSPAGADWNDVLRSSPLPDDHPGPS